MTRIYLSSPDVGELERDALLRAFDSGWIAPVGPELDGFERDVSDLTGWPGAVALSSGTAALHLALLVSGVVPGDDVLLSSFTFAATANAVVYCGANPVFIDSERASWNMSPQLLADELHARRSAGRLPKAIIVVDLHGQTADYDAIAPLCHDFGVALIEDAAEALGATHRGLDQANQAERVIEVAVMQSQPAASFCAVSTPTRCMPGVVPGPSQLAIVRCPPR